MDLLNTPEFIAFKPFLASLAIGLLFGMEREGRPSAKAGLRTFGLTALMGCLFALISAKLGSSLLLGAGALGLVAMMVAANWAHLADDDPGTTTLVALVLCYGLGALSWFGENTLAIMLAIVAAVLLHLKTELHGIAARISQRDLGSVLQFAVLALILLPILPDRNIGPFEAFNPYHTGLMVVLVAGVGLIGYAALRLAGGEHGVMVAGVLGGMVSSTATTAVFSRRAVQEPELAGAASIVILLANVTMFLRIAALAAIVAPTVLVELALPLALGAVGAVLVSQWHWRKLGRPAFSASPSKNPTELPTALGFGLLYSTVLIISAGMSQQLGHFGLYGITFVTGIPDVDAASLSSLRLLQLGKVSDVQAAVAVGLATWANLLFKSFLTATIGRGEVAKKVLPGMLAIMLCMGTGFVLMRYL